MKGEWHITEQAQYGHLGDYCVLGTAIAYEGGEMQVNQRIADNEQGYKQGQERARLIADAPRLLEENARLNEVNAELLEALKGIVGQEGYKSLWPGSRMTIERAIAKAEGKA